MESKDIRKYILNYCDIYVKGQEIPYDRVIIAVLKDRIMTQDTKVKIGTIMIVDIIDIQPIWKPR